MTDFTVTHVYSVQQYFNLKFSIVLAAELQKPFHHAHDDSHLRIWSLATRGPILTEHLTNDA